MPNDVRTRFAEIATAPDQKIDLAEAALLIAQEEYPDLCIGDYLARLNELADRARQHIRCGMSASEQVQSLNHFLFVESGFVGNNERYYDARNSYLNEVLDRRTGIPISLSVVYCEVAKRLGLPVYGVSFPGHFLVKYAGETEIIIDAFFGEVIDQAECARRLEGIYGPKVRFDHRYLRPASTREILVRMLSNLKEVYVEKHDAMRALSCVERILLLTPDSPTELRDRGILFQRLECFNAALRDFERYLALSPQDSAADAIREILPELQRQAAQLQ